MSFYPETYKDFKVSFDKELADSGNLVLNYLVENDFLLTPESKYNAVHGIFLSYSSFDNTLSSYHPAVPDYTKRHIENEEIKEIFVNNILRKINPRDNTSSIKFEIIDPVAKFNNVYNKNTRYPYLHKKVSKDSIDNDFGHSSIVWHVDSSAYNNMVTIVFLDDVSEVGGGTVISSESLVAIYDSNGILDEKQTFKNIEKLTDIKGYQSYGPAGTVVTFNSHLFHSANIPKDKPRKTMLIGFSSSNPNHFHPGPSKPQYL